MISTRSLSVYDKALFLLLLALFSGNMSGVLLLPRTFSVLLLPLLMRSEGDSSLLRQPKQLFILWGIWGLLSLAWTPDFENGYKQYILLVFNLIYAYEIIVFSIRSSRALDIIAIGWVIALSLNNCIGLWEVFTDHHLSVSKFGSEHQLMLDGAYIIMRYANGFFSNYNAFVAFTCCALPFVYYLFFVSENKYIKGIGIFNLLTSIYILFLNASRGGVAALAIISAISLYKLFKNNFNFKKALLLLGVVGLFLYRSWDSIAYIVIGRQNAIDSIEEEARYSVWQNCFRVITDSYGIGTGTGGISEAMLNYAHQGAVLAPHNAFLEILIQYGTIVFLYFIALLWGILKTAKRRDILSQTVLYSSLASMPFIFVINSVNLINPFFWAYIVSLYIYANHTDKQTI